MKLTELLVKGTKIVVDVSPGGRFTATVAGKFYGADTLEALHRKVAAATRASLTKVSVPYVRLRSVRLTNDHRFVAGVATGRHTSNGNLLIADADSKPEQHNGRGYGAECFFGADSPIETLSALYLAKLAAYRKWDAAVKKHGMDLCEEVDKAIRAVLKSEEK